MTLAIPKNEIEKSLLISKKLTKNFEPKDEWGFYAVFLFKIEIMLEDLKGRNIINTRQKNKIRDYFTPLSYWNTLNSPHLKENEKIKKEVKLLLLNDNLRRMGMSKFIRFLDCEDSA